MTTIRARVTQGGVLTTATLTPQQSVLVNKVGIASGQIRLEDLLNIDADSALDGAMLVYNSSSQLWQAKEELDNQNTKINGGNF